MTKSTEAEALNGGSRYMLRDIAILAVWQTALIGCLTFFIGWWAYSVLWMLPV